MSRYQNRDPQKPNNQVAGCEYDCNNHNLTWINSNMEYAKQFAYENCPLRKMEAQQKELLACGASVDDVLAIYDHTTHDMLKIEVCDTHITFVQMSPNGNESYPEHFEWEPYDFRLRLQEILTKLNPNKAPECVVFAF